MIQQSKNITLLTDLYQLTMSYGYFKADMHEREAVFHLFFRQNPFKGGYTIAAGLQQAIEYLQNFHFSQEDRDYLGSLKGNNSSSLAAPICLANLTAAVPAQLISFSNWMQ